jgi:hypothetical protein
MIIMIINTHIFGIDIDMVLYGVMMCKECLVVPFYFWGVVLSAK